MPRIIRFPLVGTQSHAKHTAVCPKHSIVSHSHFKNQPRDLNTPKRNQSIWREDEKFSLVTERGLAP